MTCDGLQLGRDSFYTGSPSPSNLSAKSSHPSNNDGLGGCLIECAESLGKKDVQKIKTNLQKLGRQARFTSYLLIIIVTVAHFVVRGQKRDSIMFLALLSIVAG